MQHHEKAISVDARRTEQRWFGYLLNQTAGKLRSLTTAALSPLGITPPMLRALEAIADDQPLTQVQLGSRIHMDRTTIVHVVDRFEELGYAQRTRSADDRRSHTLSLTDTGETALRQARQLARDVEDIVLAPLSSSDRRVFLRLLQTLHQPVDCAKE